MFSKFNEEARKVLINAKKEMSELKHPYIGSEHLLLAILSNKNSNISKQMKDFGLEYNNFKHEIINVIGVGTEKNEWYLYTPLLKKVIEDAVIESKDNNGEVTVEMLFCAFLREGEGIAIRIMLSMGINLDRVLEHFNIGGVTKKSKSKKKLIIDELGCDINKQVVQNEVDPVIGRDEELERVIEILSRRTKNNPLLIGDAGVGKTAIVEELARRIVKNEVPFKLKNKRIVSISMASLVAGTKYRGEFEERITKMLKELEQDPNIIIFIDEMHTLVGAGGAEGAIDASNILKPILARGKIKIIGATTTEEYKRYIEDDKALARRFQIISIDEPNIDQTKEILLKLKPLYESFHNVVVNDEIIDMIVRLSDKYMYNRKQPDKAIDILDEVCSKVSIMKDKTVDTINNLNRELHEIISQKNKAIIKQNFYDASNLRKKEKQIESKINRLESKLSKQKIPKEVTKEITAEIIKLKTKIPIYEITKENNKNILRFKEEVAKKVKGQEKAIEKLYEVIKRIKLGFKDSKKPTSLLFVGPTGVGKTMLVKEFSKYIVGSSNLITMDMSEYKEEHSVSKIIGSPPGYVGYNNKTTILEEVKNKPYAVILIDEIEKAHPSIMNLFLQILDEGRIKDSAGNIIRFDNTVIIMTSNIGFNRKCIGFNNDLESHVTTRVKEILSPEVMNRIDEIIMFNRLTDVKVKEIVNNKINQVKLKYQSKGIRININKRVIDEIIEESNYDEYGARKIDKIIDSKLDNLIIDAILLGKTRLTIQTIH